MKTFEVYPLYPLEISRGQGCKVWDPEKTQYLDMYGGHAVISIGHCHPRYVSALCSQIEKIGFYSNSVKIPQQEEAAELLGELSGYSDFSLFFCNSGAEAVENALKLASFKTGRDRILAFHGSFHGRTSLAVEATDSPAISAPVNKNGHVTFVELDDTDTAVQEIRTGNYCAVIIEGIQGIGGIRIPSDELLVALRKACTSSGTVLILDEIQSGFGRSGKFFAHQYSGIRPDLITLAKGMGNGFPVGGVAISPDFEAKHGMLGTTFGGNHLAAVATRSVLEVIRDEKLVENARIQGEYLLKELSRLQLEDVRGRGLMIGIDLPVPAKDVRNKLLFDFHIFTGSAKAPNTMRLLPPLNIGREEIDQFLEAFTAVLKSI